LILSRIGSLLLVLLLIAALVIILNPQARIKAAETVRSWQLDSKIVVNAPSINTPVVIASTPFPTATPVAEADNGGQIPVTGDQDTSNAPIIQVNWDALGNALRQFWVKLSQVKIEFNPNPPKDSK
jgi:hypothetical protein